MMFSFTTTDRGFPSSATLDYQSHSISAIKGADCNLMKNITDTTNGNDIYKYNYNYIYQRIWYYNPSTNSSNILFNIYIYVTHVYFLLNPLFFCLSPFLPWSPVTLLAHSVKPVKRQVGEREGDEETEGRWDQPFGCDQNHGKLMGDPPLGWDVWDPPSQWWDCW